MAASVYDHAHLAGLFDAGEVARLFSASADIRAMLLVEGMLAQVQGAAGIIPETSAAAIKRASLEIQIDPGSLAAPTAQNGVSVPALVAEFRAAMNAPEHAQYIHWGATSQDIIDTSLMLRLRQGVDLISADLKRALGFLADLARDHAATPMVARTWGQQAAPTSFGAVVSTWGWPLLAALRSLQALEFPVSLSGAAGTGAALGHDPVVLRANLAAALKLSDPGRSWHTDRTPVLDVARACCAVAAGFAKPGEDLVAMTQTELGEIRLGGAGASSTMPQKQNPVGPSLLVAISTMSAGLEASLTTSSLHRFQRDGSAWFAEWMALPQIVMGAATAARAGANLVSALSPDTGRMERLLQGEGLAYSEALSFALSGSMPRPEAQAVVKQLAAQVRETGTPLSDLARISCPDLPGNLFEPGTTLGTAVQDSYAFSDAARAI